MMKPARYLSIPTTHDLDKDPQLVTVATAQAVLAVIQLALERAHPILAAIRSVRSSNTELSDSEHRTPAEPSAASPPNLRFLSLSTHSSVRSTQRIIVGNNARGFRTTIDCVVEARRVDPTEAVSLMAERFKFESFGRDRHAGSA